MRGGDGHHRSGNGRERAGPAKAASGGGAVNVGQMSCRTVMPLTVWVRLQRLGRTSRTTMPGAETTTRNVRRSWTACCRTLLVNACTTDEGVNWNSRRSRAPPTTRTPPPSLRRPRELSAPAKILPSIAYDGLKGASRHAVTCVGNGGCHGRVSERPRMRLRAPRRERRLPSRSEAIPRFTVQTKRNIGHLGGNWCGGESCRWLGRPVSPGRHLGRARRDRVMGKSALLCEGGPSPERTRPGWNP